LWDTTVTTVMGEARLWRSLYTMRDPLVGHVVTIVTIVTAVTASIPLRDTTVTPSRSSRRHDRHGI
jgi:hypothetical protein